MPTAVKLMYAGAAVSTVALILWLAIAIGDVKAAARGRWLGPPVLTCLTGLATVWLLWRPDSGAFFKPHGARAS